MHQLFVCDGRKMKCAFVSVLWVSQMQCVKCTGAFVNVNPFPELYSTKEPEKSLE